MTDEEYETWVKRIKMLKDAGVAEFRGALPGVTPDHWLESHITFLHVPEMPKFPEGLLGEDFKSPAAQDLLAQARELEADHLRAQDETDLTRSLFGASEPGHNNEPWNE